MSSATQFWAALTAVMSQHTSVRDDQDEDELSIALFDAEMEDAEVRQLPAPEETAVEMGLTKGIAQSAVRIVSIHKQSEKLI